MYVVVLSQLISQKIQNPVNINHIIPPNNLPTGSHSPIPLISPFHSENTQTFHNPSNFAATHRATAPPSTLFPSSMIPSNFAVNNNGIHRPQPTYEPPFLQPLRPMVTNVPTAPINTTKVLPVLMGNQTQMPLYPANQNVYRPTAMTFPPVLNTVPVIPPAVTTVPVIPPPTVTPDKK